MADATCKTCPFFDVTMCRREPPRLLPTTVLHLDGEAEGVFPFVESDDWCGEHPLRQRDRLADMAMQGLLSDSSSGLRSAEEFAEAAYGLADAMLAARARGEEADHG